ncbi:helix-turn-helix domain-containing protein [Dietzia sp. PP-33]|jgi:AraC-like DNA-binding protein|uniref:helix-turn-helix domain-containing protein n=1 Tax=Dietzia sp. PP-33 TaxID=2957500 RepID=UPI0029B8B8E4|nr:helix-turn-helix domain-containing protein [Dietzia sp. PP-33]MDX2356599.1 AraC family transcriptional regulator [Dietzia sp. PP-33]
MGFTRELATAVPENTVRFLGHSEHVHDVPHLIHMVMGRGTLTVDRETIVLEPRASVWLAAGVPHSLSLDEHSIALGPFLAPHCAPGDRVRRLGVVPAIADLMLARLAAQPHTPRQVEVFTRSLEEIIRVINTDEFVTPLPVHPTALRIAEASVRSAAPLSTLCERSGLSMRQTQRIFVAETGLGLHRWRTRRRLNLAVRSLRAGSSGESAARAAGYSSRASLLRALSRESGVALDVLRADPLACLPATARGHSPAAAITVSDPGATSV